MSIDIASPIHKVNSVCPMHHGSFGQQKTARVSEQGHASIACDQQGIWHVRDFATARALLRGSSTRQAGFKADLLEQMPGSMRMPILYQDGAEHQQQRRKTARFFAPRTVSENYRPMMEAFSDRMVSYLKAQRRADLSVISMALAVRVAGKVVGLTDSIWPGMSRRLNVFFTRPIATPGWNLKELFYFLMLQKDIVSFFYLDVKPAIRARRKQPQEDVISHLLEQGYSDMEILTECITYGAAGMITTREFICVAAWHLLEQPELRRMYLAGDEEQRHALLEEMLRVEPVVGHLLRCATTDITIEQQGGSVTIPQGALVDLHIYATNSDERLVGAEPLGICPGRELRAERVSPAVMSFGDGHHRCPGSFLAIQESDIFLQRLLALETLKIEHTPTISWNELVKGYEIRDFIVAL